MALLNPQKIEDLEELKAEVRRLRLALEEKTLEADALHRVGQAIASADDIDQMLQVVAEVAVSVTGTETCFIYLLDETRNELVMRAIYGADPSVVGKIRLHMDEGVTGWVARVKKPLAIPREAWKDPRFKYFPELQEEQYESFLSVPIIAKDRTIGVINVRTASAHEYTPAQIHLLNTIAGQVAGALELARLHHASQTRASQLTALSEVSKTLTSNLYLEEILQLIVTMTAETMNFKICSIMLLDEEREELVIKATSSNSVDYREKPNIKIGESASGKAVLSRQPVIVEDVRKSPEYRYPDIAKKEGLCSLICLPLVFKERIIGVLNCYTAKPHRFTDEEIRLLSTLSNQAAIAIENSKLMVKSAIIQEMHHRIKNNLQTIASLLRLQMYSKTGSLEEILRESINRILSIAAVHDLLSREDLNAVSFQKIAESILSAIKQNFVRPGKKVSSLVQGEDLMMPASQATAMALVLNELIQNALEHGIEPVEEGVIKIVLNRKDNDYVMEVRNTGSLIPLNFSWHTCNSLGLKIVDSLVRENLRGRFCLVQEGSETVARVEFPVPNPYI